MTSTNNHGKATGTGQNLPEAPQQQQLGDRLASVDSEAYFEPEDQYDDYDDFDVAGSGGGGGGGRGRGNTAKQNRRQDNRGGGGSGSVYSAKHVRLKEAQRKSCTPSKSTKQK